MKIIIKSRKTVESIAKTPFSIKTAIISIVDYGDEEVHFENMPQELLRVSFDDVDGDVFIDELGRNKLILPEERLNIEEKYKMISDEQALQIAEFYKRIAGRVQCLICQCEHGQSRSAAVAAAFLEYRYKSGIRIFSDDNYYPNKYVFRKLLKALRGEMND